MKRLTLYVLGAFGIAGPLHATAKLVIPDLGGLRTPLIAALAVTIWVPLHLWLTHGAEQANRQAERELCAQALRDAARIISARGIGDAERTARIYDTAAHLLLGDTAHQTMTDAEAAAFRDKWIAAHNHPEWPTVLDRQQHRQNRWFTDRGHTPPTTGEDHR